MTNAKIGTDTQDDGRSCRLTWGQCFRLLNWYREQRSRGASAAGLDPDGRGSGFRGASPSRLRAATVAVFLGKCPYRFAHNSILEVWLDLLDLQEMVQGKVDNLQRSAYKAGNAKYAENMQKQKRRVDDAIERFTEDRQFGKAREWLVDQFSKCASDDPSFMRF